MSTRGVAAVVAWAALVAGAGLVAGTAGATPTPESTTGPTADAAVSPVAATPATDADPAPNGTVNGTVTGFYGTPAGNARVLAVRTDGNAHRLVRADAAGLLETATTPPVALLRSLASPPRPPGVYVARTDSSGEFSLSLPPGEYAVRAVSPSGVAPGYGHESVPAVAVSAGETESVDLQLGGHAGGGCPECADLDVGTASGNASETVTVPVSVDLSTDDHSGDRALAGYRVELTYSPRVVELVDVEGDPPVDAVFTGDGRVSVRANWSTPSTPETFLTVRFRVVADRPAETFLLPTANTTLYGRDGQLPVWRGRPDGRIERPYGSVVDRYDRAPADGSVDTGELQAALGDWSRGRLSGDDLRALIEAWVRD